MVMEQVLKRIGNSYMLSVSPKSIKKNKIDKTTKLEQLENDEGTGIISFRIIRPQKLVFPKIKGKLKRIINSLKSKYRLSSNKRRIYESQNRNL